MRYTKPFLAKPNGFDEFWTESFHEICATNTNVRLDQVSEVSPGLSHYALTFTSLQLNPINGYLLAWNKKTAPLVIHTNGYNGQYDLQSQWAMQGVNVLGFDTRGFGRSHCNNPLSSHGHILTGIDTPCKSILKGAVCDYIQSHRAAKQILGDQISRTLYYGFSFAGAMAIQAAAISQLADLVVAGVPTFGWHKKRSSMTLSGSAGEVNRYLQTHPDQAQRVLNTLDYFDTIHFAPMLTCPTLIGVGLKDGVVPPETVFAVANHLNCTHKVREFSESHSGNDDAIWKDFTKEMLTMAHTGNLSPSCNNAEPSACDQALGGRPQEVGMR